MFVLTGILLIEYFKVKYLVSLVTGEIPDTQDKSNAFIVLMGERGFTGNAHVLHFYKNKSIVIYQQIAAFYDILF